MERGVWAVLAIGATMLIAVWTLSALQERAHSQQVQAVDQVLDEVERDMGTYDSLEARNTPMLARVKRQAAIAASQAESNKRLLDSLAQVSNAELGASYPSAGTAEATDIVTAER